MGKIRNRGMKMRESIKKKEKGMIFLLIITMPIMFLPERYNLPLAGSILPLMILYVLLLALGVQYVLEKFIYLPHYRFFLFFCFWVIVCTIIGAYRFPFWNEAFDRYLMDTNVVKVIEHIWPGIIDSPSALHFKYFVSSIWGIVKNLIVPLGGIFFIFTNMYSKSSREGISWISKAAFFWQY